MISQDAIRRLATKDQTSPMNIAREYCQHLFLSNLYRQRGSEKVLFKGGTALKIIYRSPRFSEDLDFSCSRISPSSIDMFVEDALIEIEREGIEVDIKESKGTSGGYLAIVAFEFLGYSVGIQVEVSSRRKSMARGTTTLISSELVPPYTVVQLNEEALVAEKLEALLTRLKPRDFYDLYFILRSRLALPKLGRERDLKGRLLMTLQDEKVDFKRELKLLLPASHQQILKDFKSALINEVKRAL